MSAEKKLERILFIAAEMEARGTNEYVSYLAEELQKRELKVRVFCAPGPMVEVLNEKNIPSTTFKHLAGFRFPHKRRTEFFEELEAFSPDLIHAPNLRALNSFVKITKGYEVPMVVTMHSAPKKPRQFRMLTPHLSGIIVTSQKVREEIVNGFKFPKNKIVMICNGVNVEEIRANAPKPAFSRPVPVLGSVGPVERARGHELFVRSASILMQEGRKVHFVIAGEGGEISRLSKMGSQFGLDKCLTFVRDFASYHEVLGALDVVVQSAQVDVSGFSIIDAMGSGRPVVAFNTGTACEIIDDGQSGLIVPKDDSEALAKALMNLVDNPSRARDLGNGAKRSVEEKFNISKNAGEVIDFYKRI